MIPNPDELQHKPARPIPPVVIKTLAAYFQRSGYVRPTGEPHPATEQPVEADDAAKVKRGFEFRLTAETAEELRAIRCLLKQAQFKPGKPLRKGKQFRQPVYGRAEMERFLALMAEAERMG